MHDQASKGVRVKKLFPVILFLGQVWLTFRGHKEFGKYLNPVILFVDSVAIAILFSDHLNTSDSSPM